MRAMRCLRAPVTTASGPANPVARRCPAAPGPPPQPPPPAHRPAEPIARLGPDPPPLQGRPARAPVAADCVKSADPRCSDPRSSPAHAAPRKRGSRHAAGPARVGPSTARRATAAWACPKAQRRRRLAAPVAGRSRPDPDGDARASAGRPRPRWPCRATPDGGLRAPRLRRCHRVRALRAGARRRSGRQAPWPCAHSGPTSHPPTDAAHGGHAAQ
mmetsp:Transcript_44566/g.104730  ORF Transcript_44566/g.104730 Transcript_44566/m.104730 type:complete len:215 (-) Transcript_44566:1357-2001(-)